jgi:Rps23 Pro-64 3,4-dihydroxylase Tpa1-like proline 4-hydroxylase
MQKPQEIEVTVLLTGGHQHSLLVQPDDPLLRRLFAVLLDTQNTAPEVFQLPVQRGRAMLCFRSDRLVGLMTDPPIVIQPQPDAIEPSVEETIVPSEYVQIDHFLSPAEHKRLLNYTLQQRKAFVPTTTSTNVNNYRESMVLHSFPEFSDILSQKVAAVVPDILNKLGQPPFTIDQIEAQLTAHNDGNFYKIHNDSGCPITATRELTYVYYFNREPKSFTGGELVIYDSKIQNNYFVQAESFKAVEPRNNSIVFFLSRCMHEVLPVKCPSQAFADSRFTINGWVRRKG